MKVTGSCLIDRDELASAVKSLKGRMESAKGYASVGLSLFEARAILNLLEEMQSELKELDSQCSQ